MIIINKNKNRVLTGQTEGAGVPGGSLRTQSVHAGVVRWHARCRGGKQGDIAAAASIPSAACARGGGGEGEGRGGEGCSVRCGAVRCEGGLIFQRASRMGIVHRTLQFAKCVYLFYMASSP